MYDVRLSRDFAKDLLELKWAWLGIPTHPPHTYHTLVKESNPNTLIRARAKVRPFLSNPNCFELLLYCTNHHPTFHLYGALQTHRHGVRKWAKGCPFSHSSEFT